MTRKLQHTFQALMASAAVFSLMLIAGGPAPAPAASPVVVPTAILVAASEATEAVEAIDTPAVDAEATSDGRARQFRRHRRGHATAALPYFSFAQGLRHVAGG